MSEGKQSAGGGGGVSAAGGDLAYWQQRVVALEGAAEASVVARHRESLAEVQKVLAALFGLASKQFDAEPVVSSPATAKKRLMETVREVNDK